MANDARYRILFVGVDRTAGQAGRVRAVMAGRGDRLLKGRFRRATDEQAGAAPCLCFLESVEVVAGDDASLACRASIEIDFKRVLLSRPGGRRRHELGVIARLRGHLALIMAQGIPLHGRQILLIPQRAGEQIGHADRLRKRCGGRDHAETELAHPVHAVHPAGSRSSMSSLSSSSGSGSRTKTPPSSTFTGNVWIR